MAVLTVLNYQKWFKDIKTKDCVLGRLENDKFLIMTNLEKTEAIDLVKDKFDIGFQVNNIEIKIKFTYTVINYPSQGEDFETLVTNLMQTAHLKHNDHRKIIIYKDEYADLFNRRLEIELSLDESLINREFDVVFQPIVLKDDPSKIRGVEALARWKHPRLNNISPGEFVPILEKTGKVSRLDRLIIFEAVKRIANMSKSLDLDYILSCNVSVDTLMDEGFPQFIKDTLHKFKFNPNYFEIEITESTIIKNPIKTIEVINNLTAIGVRFSQDDFESKSNKKSIKRVKPQVNY